MTDDVSQPFPFPAAWTIHSARWELEMVGTPGLFDVECQLDAADWARIQKEEKD